MESLLPTNLNWSTDWFENLTLGFGPVSHIAWDAQTSSSKQTMANQRRHVLHGLFEQELPPRECIVFRDAVGDFTSTMKFCRPETNMWSG